MTSEKREKILSIIGIAIFLIITAALFIVVGKPMISFVSNPQGFRDFVSSSGILGALVFIGMVVFQIVVAIVPGEPFEIAAGYAFGAVEGTILTLIGDVIGSTLVFLLVKKFGVKMVELFFSKEKIDNIKFLKNTERLNIVAFIIFFIPGTPKDILSYVMGLTKMKLTTWILITATARIPSVITSTIGGDALGMQNYMFAIIVFVVTAIISAVGILIYRNICKKQNLKSKAKEEAEKDKKAIEENLKTENLSDINNDN